MSKKIGVLLCGCGHRDGSEVHESTLALLAIDEAGAEAICFAPKGPQRYVRDHFTGKDTGESRDMFTESARIARGKIRDIVGIRTSDIDALIIPGGQGAALNLSDFIDKGPQCTVHPEVERLISEMVESKKPIGAICISPATVARVFQKLGINAMLTLGTDEKLNSRLEAMGQRAKPCPAIDCVVDPINLIASTPAYILAQNLSELRTGIDKCVGAVIAMI